MGWGGHKKRIGDDYITSASSYLYVIWASIWTGTSLWSHKSQRESLANAKVSAWQQCVYEEIYGKSTQGTMLHAWQYGFSLFV